MADQVGGRSPLRGVRLMTIGATKEKNHPIRLYLDRVASQDVEVYPEWDLTKPLPKLPVPKLEDTLTKYLDIIRSTVSESQYEKTRRIVQEFGKEDGMGELLQGKLLKHAEEQDNWVYQFWLDDMYMKVRLPLPINSNPGMVFPRQYFEDQSAQLRYAARFISGILDYKVVIDNRLLPVDRARSREKGQPLCMEQYYKLFTSYRYPGLGKDCLVTSSTGQKCPDKEHIIVAYKNQFFAVDLVVDSIRLSDDNIYSQLKRCVKMVEEEISRSLRMTGYEPLPVGIMTSASRDVWAGVRRRLAEDENNLRGLEEIEKCMFVICLDSQVKESGHRDERSEVSMAMQMIHGLGSRVNSGNRWFEKTMQFIIAEDGACGLCYEHSAAEGIAVVQLIEHILAYMDELQRKRLTRMQSLCDLALPRHVTWKLDEDVKAKTCAAAESLDRSISNLDLHVLRFLGYGKDFPKSQNMSPDAYIQIALQLTYYKIHGRLVSTYESASIRRFRQGRVDNIRANSMEALEWCKAMMEGDKIPPTEKMSLLRSAMKKQTDILVQAILGYGIDNHLLGLRQIAEDCAIPVPEIFTDESYRQSNHFSLSTSQVPTTMDALMCYGPVVPDGYGACYNPHPNYILVCVSSFKENKTTDSREFAMKLQETFQEMKALCLTSSVHRH
uniref:Choline O-acetyltransferase n=1 Tax=Hirudo verbana TaxID=311461 RepID=A0A2S1WM72_9ANNE|nr:putative choline acetyltransferase [Hirudo verbana]